MAERTCSIDGCEKGGKMSRGMCRMHYRRWWLHGDPHFVREVHGKAEAPRVRVAPPLAGENAAWFAGIFEGEGTIRITRGKHVALVIAMTDRDVIERVDALVPTKSGPWLVRAREARYKDNYRWGVGRAPVVEATLRAILPWLGERRRARAEEALHVLANHHPGGYGHYLRAKTHCPHGHAYDEANTIVTSTGSRACKKCRRESEKRYEERSRRARAERLAAQVAGLE